MTSETNEDRDDDIELPDGQLDILTAVENAAGDMAALYTRESSDVEPLLTHTETELGYRYDDDARKRIVYNSQSERATGLNAEHGYDGVGIIRGGESHPTGVERLIEFVTGWGVDDVVAANLAAFGGVDESTRAVERLQDEGTTVHLIDDKIVIEPGDDRVRDLLAAARRAARNDNDTGRELVTEAITGGGWTGRPPLGFTVAASGQLRRNDRWDELRNTFKTHDDGLITEYRASQLLDCSRDAVRNAVTKYRDLYRLDAPDIDATADADTDAV